MLRLIITPGMDPHKLVLNLKSTSGHTMGLDYDTSGIPLTKFWKAPLEENLPGKMWQLQAINSATIVLIVSWYISFLKNIKIF